MTSNLKPLVYWATGDGINIHTARKARERVGVGCVMYGRWFLTAREWRVVKQSMGHPGRPART
jgi:hypothetical protein